MAGGHSPYSWRSLITFGRDTSNRIVLRDEKSSRRHCDIFYEGSHWWVRDLNSSNGTRVNGESIRQDSRLSDGAVRSKSFRQDLFYRLQILDIFVPPLREHLSDIPALAQCFLERCCGRIGHEPLRFTDQAVDALCDYDWPGNVRELRNVIERAVVLADGPEIDASHIRFLSGTAALLADNPSLQFEPAPLEQLEQDHILRTLRWTKWRKREAARLLGINRSTLDRKLERYDFKAPPED